MTPPPLPPGCEGYSVAPDIHTGCPEPDRDGWADTGDDMDDLTIGEIHASLPQQGWVRHGDVWFTRNLTDEAPDLCPQGCGRMTEDPYGGPCKACWDEVPS